ncbi:MAG: glycosyltransferase family 4 protein [Desulfuromonadales bacterium]|nr:glycosyltransferase family 4 protein [Desulfuromonadales bacterium]
MAKVMLIGGVAESLLGFRGQLLQDMVAHGHEVIACAPNAKAQIITRLKNIGVDYQDFPLHRTGINPLQDLRSIWVFVRLFRKIRPDVVLNYTIKPTIYGSMAATIAKVTNISSMITGLGYAFSKSSLKQRLVGQVATLLYRVGLRSNKVVFFQNPDDLALFCALGIVTERNHPTLIGGSGIDLNYFSVCPLPQTASFLLIARLIREKGVCEYVEAARQLHKKYPKARFCLVGMVDSNPSAIRSEDIDEWSRAGFIEFLGRLEDVRPAIADSSVFVLPSYREGVSHATLEAMAMGRPIITTDAPGCRETVVEGLNGFLVPIMDTDALANAMERFILDPSLSEAMGEQSRLLAADRFDVRTVNHIIMKNLELINEAVA